MRLGASLVSLSLVAAPLGGCDSPGGRTASNQDATTGTMPDAATASSSPDVVPTGPCDDHGDCGAGYCVRATGRCVDCRDTADCGALERCDAGVCVATSACDSDLACTPMGLVCTYEGCQACGDNADCGDGSFCRSGGCQPFVECDSSLDCATGEQVCGAIDIGRLYLHGVCVDCVSEAECGQGERCQGGRCEPHCRGSGRICGDGCGECPGNERCSGDGLTYIDEVPLELAFVGTIADSADVWFGVREYAGDYFVFSVDKASGAREILASEIDGYGGPPIATPRAFYVVDGAGPCEVHRIDRSSGASVVIASATPYDCELLGGDDRFVAVGKGQRNELVDLTSREVRALSDRVFGGVAMRGSSMYWIDREQLALFVMDTHSLGHTRITDAVGGFPDAPFERDGWLYFIASGGRVVRAALDGSNATTVFEGRLMWGEYAGPSGLLLTELGGDPGRTVLEQLAFVRLDADHRVSRWSWVDRPVVGAFVEGDGVLLLTGSSAIHAP